ncbi:MAG: histidine phosphatase family protein [Actinobacteria bacterium]|nr:histidine phosphatase family protein [Actinomycetota bacterium]
MELLLIRHGLPVRRELREGIADPELAPAGHQQARYLAEYLATEAIDAIYSSPQQRAVQTAKPIAASRGLEIKIVDDVAEWDRNSSEYVPIEELKAEDDPRWQAILRGEWNMDDASPAEFRGRVVNAIETLIAAHQGHRIAVSCHGGVINAYLAHVLGLPVTHGFFYPGYTSIHRVMAATTGRRSILSINEIAHLRGRTGP